jgi:type I restriction enzyme S subunit
MELRSGYKQTEVGVIPQDWDVKPLQSLAHVERGKFTARPRNDPKYYGGDIPFIQTGDVANSGGWIRSHSQTLNQEGLKVSRLFPRGTLFFTIAANIGDVGFAGFDTACPDSLVAIIPTKKIDKRWLAYELQTRQRSFENLASHNAQLNLNLDKLRPYLLPVPTQAEQEAIAEALSDADRSIESLEQLLVKKRQLTQGAMQELLTGKKRLPGFGGEWTVKPIAEIAFPSSDKNVSGEHLPVLTCSKHLGFVDSLAYFKNQVFSRDTSGYKVVKRGQIGYPSNHVEEGSIGLQDLYDVALVSPIYVVFSVIEEVDSYFLHRLLKLDSYRQAFATATSSSVDRRGSLRWPAFSQIAVNLPRFE